MQKERGGKRDVAKETVNLDSNYFMLLLWYLFFIEV